MTIRAAGFEPLKGTVFVVIYKKNPSFNLPVAQAVFKGKPAADKFANRAPEMLEVRVGHFSETNRGTIETI